MIPIVYRCDVCGHSFVWGNGDSQYFGSHDDREKLGLAAVVLLCSSECKTSLPKPPKAVKRGKISPEFVAFKDALHEAWVYAPPKGIVR